MAYSKDKLQPSNTMRALLAPVVFNDVRSTSEHTTNRNRQCYTCMQKIEKGDKYINHQFKYDKRIVTISFHKGCFVCPLCNGTGRRVFPNCTPPIDEPCPACKERN